MTNPHELLTVEVPDFCGEPIADTHAHLDMLEDPSLAIARAAVAGVSFIATVANVVESPERTFDGLNGWLSAARTVLDGAGFSDTPLPEVRIIVGVHPHNAAQVTLEVDATIRALAGDPRVCALGELGLDYYYDHSPREIQRQVFRRHLALAHELNLPVCIHLRDAHDDGYAILAEISVPARGAVLHCITVGPDVAAPFIELGCTPSFAGPVTFKKGEDIRESAASADPANIMAETDCPFMAPEPHRGQKNEPAMVAFNIAKLADVHELSPRDMARLTSETARRVYGAING